ncbi:AAA family ATPase [Micromonospora sp. NPDC049049]|uniref:AAA family ATPase n=1 Tax=Micromonospora sp. NPDC049049 TaxID=3155495 RepID=UPI0033DAFDA9
MSLVGMTLGSYRCFARRQDIELRPITLVLGRNNAGKSALVRAPVVFGTGIRTESPEPLDLDQLGESMVDSFTDLVYGNRALGSFQLGLALDGAAGPIELKATVQHVREHHTQVVSELTVTTGGVRRFRLEWELTDPRQTPRYTIEAGETTWTEVPVLFQGLLPVEVVQRDGIVDGIPPAIETELLGLSMDIRASFPRVRYFGPFRDRAQRRYRLPGRAPAEIGITGEHAAGILASDKVRNQSRLIRQLNEQFAEQLPGWKLDVAERGGMWSVVLTSRDDDTIQVNLADAGTGVAQALPVFVQRAADLLHPSDQSVLEIIEQPELHLHPAAHAALAELYLTAAQNTSTRFLIETHSETLLLRLRRRIAGGLDPALLAVYFVDSLDGAAVARRIHVDEAGNLDYWPAGVFSEDYEETKELARVQWERRDARAG